MHVSSRELVNRGQEGVGFRQTDGLAIRVGKVKHRRQVTRHRTPPRRDIGLEHTKTLLDKLDHGGVIEDLRIDIPSLTPRRDHQERNPLAETNRVPRRRRGHDFVFDADSRGPVSSRVRWGWRQDMVETSVGLVVVDDEDGLAENVGVRHQNVEDL